MKLSEDFRRIFIRKPLRVLLCAAAFVILAVLGLFLAERYVRFAADAEVPAGRPTVGELHAALRPTTRNAAALRLEVLAAELGLNLVPKGMRGTRPSKQKRERFEALRKGALGDLFVEIEARPDDEDVPAPAAVRAFLSDHDEDLTRLAEFLRESGPGLVWDFDRDLFHGPEPNLLGILVTTRLLEVAALEADRSGNPAKAATLFEASLGLNDALARRSELICLLISLAIEGVHHVQLRRFRNVDEAWIGRLERRQLLPAAVDALRLEAVGMEGGADMDGVPFWMWPYVRLQIADAVRRKDRLAFAHEGMSWRDLRRENLEALWKDPSPRWNIVGRIAWGGLEALPYRVLRRNLDREVTSLILRGRSEGLPTCEVPSLVAPGHTIRLTRQEAGRFEVEALVAPETPPDGARNLLPTRFHASRRS